MLTIALGTLSWNRDPQLAYKYAQMNLSSALKVWRCPSNTAPTVQWADSYIPVLCPPWAAGAPAWILSVCDVSFVQAEFLIGKVLLEMPYMARSFHFQAKISSKGLKDVHTETHL